MEYTSFFVVKVAVGLKQRVVPFKGTLLSSLGNLFIIGEEARKGVFSLVFSPAYVG